ncbi:hypothetical protein F4779DRAFT_612790 [Xylariaceae sp. FL0662B]|nr:hypothetical protein F4779DRAFT_612790 [Xylariaceae sp. FL0662B]
MADPLSVVLGLVPIAVQVAKGFRLLRARWREAPDIVARITQEVGNTQGLLETLQLFLQENPDISVRNWWLVETLDQCQVTLNNLEELINSEYRNDSDSSDTETLPEKPGPRRRVVMNEAYLIAQGQPQRRCVSPEAGRPTTKRRLIDRFKWTTTKRRRAEELLNQLKGQSQKLQLALQTQSFLGLRELEHGIRDVEASMNDNAKREILAWLRGKDLDLQSIHTEQCDKRAEETCDWLTATTGYNTWWGGGSPDINGWRRYLWIHGIPGAGKTVLASFLIDDVAKRCESRGFSYYYCQHQRNRDETVHLLRWIIADLSRQIERYIPEELAQLRKSQVFTIRGLMNCFSAISRQFEREGHRVYVLIDAVDESKAPRTQLLQVLNTIGSHRSFKNVSLLMTSREEEDIQEAMKTNDMVDGYQLNMNDMEVNNFDFSPPYTGLTMSNAEVMQAIRTYVKKQLNGCNHFQRWDPEFRDRVGDELARQARGMFRWVACQIDIIKRIYYQGEAEVLAALRDMPETLFETYERILENIPRENRAFARTALALICSNTSDIPSANVLVKASLHDVQHGTMHRYNVALLKEILGCLIKVTKLKRKPGSIYPRENEAITFEKVDVAHYTVREFLFAPSTMIGKAKDFALSSSTTKSLEMQVIFIGLLQFRPINNRRGIPDRYEEYCLKRTQHALLKQRAFIMREDKVWEVVVPCLSPSSLHLRALSRQDYQREFSEWAKLLAIDETLVEDRATEGPPRKIQPETGILASLVLLKWPEFAQKYLESDFYQSLSAGKKAAIWTDTFVANKGNKEAREERPQTLLRLTVSRKHVEFVEIFIQAGATFHNEPDIIFVALDNPYGVNDGDGTTTGKLIKILLENGADPNPPGYTYNPLQFAVHYLEEGWVQALLLEGRGANEIGDPAGVLPVGCDEADEWHSMHPLKICRKTKVKWGNGDDVVDEVQKARDRVMQLLIQYGARAPPEPSMGAVINLV